MTRLLLSLLLCSPALASAGALDQLRHFLDNASTAQASFSQQVLNKSGRAGQQASGSMSFQRPGKFRWEYTKPYRQLIVGDGSKLWTYDEDLNQVVIKPMSDALGASPAALLAGSNDLISIRGRATFTRPFDRVDALRLSAEDRFRAKEQELEQQLQDTEQKLAALETGRNESSEVLLTPEQEQELERFQREKLRIRKELRDVRLQLDQDIRELGNRLRFTNIVVVPLIFAGLTLLVALWRRRRQAAIAMLQRDRERPSRAGGGAGA